MPSLSSITARIVVAHELWLTLFCVPFLLFPGPLTPAVLMLILLPWFCRRAVHGNFTKRTALDWPILGLLAMSLVGLWPALGREEGLVVLCQVVAGVSLFYGVANWAGSKQRIIFVAAMSVLGGALLAAVAPFATRWPAHKLPLWEEIYPALPALLWLEDSVHPNVLAGALVPLVLVGFSLFYEIPPSFIRREKWLARLALALALGMMVVAVALTQSRGGWLAMAVGLVAFGCLRYRWFLAALPIFALEGVVLAGRFGVIPLADFLLGDSSLGGLAERLEVWERAWEMVRDFPFTGIGLGAFPALQGGMYPTFSLSGPLSHAHNLFLQVALTLGLPGLGFFLALMFLGGWQAFRACRAAALSALAGGLFSGIIAITAHGLLDAVLWGTKPSVVLWLILGLTCALLSYQLSAFSHQLSVAKS